MTAAQYRALPAIRPGHKHMAAEGGLENGCACVRNGVHIFPRFTGLFTETGRSAAWLARLPWEQEVECSNHSAPTMI